jgi:transcription elongation factor Elf1
MTEKLRPSAFHCPHCAAKYALVKVEAVSSIDAKVRCISCGGPLDSRENAFILKYFLVERPRHNRQHAPIGR